MHGMKGVIFLQQPHHHLGILGKSDCVQRSVLANVVQASVLDRLHGYLVIKRVVWILNILRVLACKHGRSRHAQSFADHYSKSKAEDGDHLFLMPQHGMQAG